MELKDRSQAHRSEPTSAASKPAALTEFCWMAYEHAAWLLALAGQPRASRSSSDDKCHLPNCAVV